jgi:hypothetical protein
MAHNALNCLKPEEQIVGAVFDLTAILHCKSTANAAKIWQVVFVG